jgi:hypothetical protein
MSEKIKKIICFLLVSFFITSCNEEEAKLIPAEKSYFDLERLILNDIKNNTRNNCIEEKTVYMNSVKETRKNDSVHWQDELKPLLECDINKKAWKGKFFADTIPNELMKDTTLQYRALSDKVSVRSLSIIYTGSQIKKIIIVKKIDSFLFSTSQIINYIPGIGFIIRGEQKAFMMNTYDLNVDVKYICKN